MSLGIDELRVENIPRAVREFVLDHIDSVELLEVLLLLRKYPAEQWTVQRISDELRTNPSSVENRVSVLVAKNLLVHVSATDKEALYQYMPSDNDLISLIDDVARCYAEKRVSFIELIFSRPRQTIQTFAEAFRFRKD